MADRPLDLANVDFRQVFPWIHLFRGFRIAFDLKKMFLGAVGALAMSLGGTLIASIFSADLQELGEVRGMLWQARTPDVYRSPVSIEDGWRSDGLPSSFWMVIEPLRQMTYPVRLMFQRPQLIVPGFLLTVWTLLVWSLAGGAITRIAAVQVAREGYVSLKESFQFVFSRWRSYLLAPVLPFAAIVAMALCCTVGGALTRVPVLDVLMGLFSVLALVAGFLMALALVGLALGWPLMYAALGAEATESFDALSRAYSYVLPRLWNYLFYVVLAVGFGGIVCVLVVTFSTLTVEICRDTVGFGGNETDVRALFHYAPAAAGWREMFGSAEAPTGSQWLAAVLVGFWTHLAFLGMVGFAYSFFWSESTILYFLLRLDVDDTEIEEVYLDEEDEEPFPTVGPSALEEPAAPLAGVPASASVLPIVEPPLPAAPPAGSNPGEAPSHGAPPGS